MPGGFGDGTIFELMLRPTPDSSDSPTVADHYEAALQAGCDALVTLQLIAYPQHSSAGLGYDQAQIDRAIKLLRTAIDELRLAQTERPSAPLAAFVLETCVADTVA